MKNNRTMEHLSTRGVVRWFCDQIPGLDAASRDNLVYEQLVPIPFEVSNAKWFAGLHEDGRLQSLQLAEKPVAITVNGLPYDVPVLNPHTVMHGEKLFHITERDRLHEISPIYGRMWVHFVPPGDWRLPYQRMLAGSSFEQYLNPPVPQTALLAS